MTPKDLKRWRKSLGLSQKEAAHALGLKRRVIQYYEKGERNGGRLEIPLYVRLACFALTQGATDYAGPPDNDAKAAKPARKAAKAAAKGNKGSKRLTASPESEVEPPDREAVSEAPPDRAAETLLPDPLSDPVPAPGTRDATAPRQGAPKQGAPKRAAPKKRQPARAAATTASAGKAAPRKAASRKTPATGAQRKP